MEQLSQHAIDDRRVRPAELRAVGGRFEPVPDETR